MPARRADQTDIRTKLGVELDDLIEDEWREWYVFDAHRAAQAPDPDRFWRRREHDE